MIRLVGTLVSLLMLAWCGSADEGFVANEASCAELGFVIDALQCSTCERLEQALHGREMVDAFVGKCNLCCMENENKDGDAVYHTAVLEVHTQIATHRFPEIGNFLKDRARKFISSGKLKVKNKWNHHPELVLRDKNGAKASTVNVQSWKSEQLEEFLNNKVG
uniref:Selenoprotein F n=1 Tax=Mucochytrium quahogii TaxID=96639 RepID=A0A7S2S6W0_9STRA|mmetsp:Transcript_3377/g.4885  ORF Transcript_3377/g.4885 Transcript_3377/m.4885 type:complete len:163 (+) Transcript_3377:201-689(+)|eukprot:CAMPEP_0203760246 /NCGR_PEP_ID=MMETSP0098-20131031/13584_1 /ASSEMBLY_ACC=CAM_ASM_000208 /TAXON_ID=96639 /ORGANISM=" , Strain NY0313808BC1" /LENGTH=162 /DNA_ID=CAMNT_0050653739 /DNA_START=221 /DNA_END=709 /DNA_ORIENTATION=-